MNTLREKIPVGSLVSLEVRWGNQSRLQCPRCRHFTSGSQDVHCRCGAVYKAHDDGYQVVVMP